MSEPNKYKNPPSFEEIETLLAEIFERRDRSKEMHVIAGLGWCKDFVKQYGKVLFLFGVDNGNIGMHPGIWDYVNELRNQNPKSI